MINEARSVSTFGHLFMARRFMCERIWATLERQRAYEKGWSGEKQYDLKAHGREIQLPITWFRWWAMIHCEALRWALEEFSWTHRGHPIVAIVSQFDLVYKAPFDDRLFGGTQTSTSGAKSAAEAAWWTTVLAIAHSGVDRLLPAPRAVALNWVESFDALRARLVE